MRYVGTITMFSVTAKADADTLLTSTSETLASVKAMAGI